MEISDLSPDQLAELKPWLDEQLKKALGLWEMEVIKLRGEKADLRRQLDACLDAERQRTDLDAIRRAADDILDALNPADSDEPINWGDLGAVRAMQCVDERGYRWVRVEIEEAAPGCEKLCAAVAAGLAERGWPDVEVATEW